MKKYKIILSVVVILLAVLGLRYYFASFDEVVGDVEPLAAEPSAAKVVQSNKHQKLRESVDLIIDTRRKPSAPKKKPVHESSLPGDDKQQLIWAREMIRDGDEDQKLQALQLLIQLAPEEAIEVLRNLATQSAGDESASALIAHGMVAMTDLKEVFANSDLSYIYEVGGAQVQKVSALILAERGDEALTQRYLDSIAMKLKSNNPQDRSQILQEMGSMGSTKVVPYALNSLDDSNSQVKIDALSLLAQYGSNNTRAAAEALLNDANAEVRQQALQTVEILGNKNSAPYETQKNVAQPQQDSASSPENYQPDNAYPNNEGNSVPESEQYINPEPEQQNYEGVTENPHPDVQQQDFIESDVDIIDAEHR